MAADSKGKSDKPLPLLPPDTPTSPTSPTRTLKSRWSDSTMSTVLATTNQQAWSILRSAGDTSPQGDHKAFATSLATVVDEDPSGTPWNRSEPRSASQQSGEIQIMLDDTARSVRSIKPWQEPRRAQKAAPSHRKSSSATLTPRTEAAIRSKFYSQTTLSRAKSAVSSLPSSSMPNSEFSSVPVTPKVPIPSKSLSGPPSAYRTPRQRVWSPQPPFQEPRPASAASSKKSSVLSRFGSLKPLNILKKSKYEKIRDQDDDDDDEVALTAMNRSDTVTTRAYTPLGFDIGSFEGPAHVPHLQPAKSQSRKADLINGSVQDDELEAQGVLTRGLGGGMDDVMEARMSATESEDLQETTSKQGRWSLSRNGGWLGRRPSKMSVKRAGQVAAEASGYVVAVEEEVGVDLSNVEGGVSHQDKTKTIVNTTALPTSETVKQSYYFPPDPQMPGWRPFPMTKRYILLLVLLALILAAVQEYLVQLSIQRPGKGLLYFTDPNEVSTGDWFVWKYLPEMVLVTYGVMFQAVDFEIRRLEPYYQMSRPGGATAAQSLNLDYLTFWSYLVPIKAFHHRQWAVVLTSISTIMASAVVPVLFSAALNMNPDRSQRFTDTVKYVSLDPVLSRLMEAALFIVAILGILLILQLRRRSGLVSDPRGIAGVCAMATRSHILNDFRGLDMVSHNTIHKSLRQRRYILHKSSLWQGEYLTSRESDSMPPVRTQNPHPLALHLRFGLGYIGCILLFLAIVPIIEFTPANIVISKLPWLLTLFATLLKVGWTNLETGVRIIEPFYILSRRHAPASTLALDYTGTVPGYFPIRAALNGHYLVAAVGLGSILTEVLTVCVASFNVDGKEFLRPATRRRQSPTTDPSSPPDANTAETLKSYWTSLIAALVIPLLLATIAAVVYTRRRHAFLPRQPGTIASVLAFIHQSRMLYDFVGDVDNANSTCTRRSATADRVTDASMPPPAPSGMYAHAAKLMASLAGAETVRAERHRDVARETVEMLTARGRTFGLGWYKGRDGLDHLGVDVEELLSDYFHGMDWSKGRVGGEEIGRWEVY